MNRDKAKRIYDHVLSLILARLALLDQCECMRESDPLGGPDKVLTHSSDCPLGPFAGEIDTLGHKQEAHDDARPGVRYPGAITFAAGAYGCDRMILSAEFGDEAGYGPWFYEGVHDWLFEQEAEPGRLYRFNGWYRLCRDGSHEFVGETTSTPIGAIGDQQEGS